MKVTIKKQTLENLVSSLNPYVDRRDLSSIISHIYLKASNGVLELKATDQEIGLEFFLTNDIDIKEEGEATANGKSLQDIIKGLKNGEITLETNKDTLIVKQNRSRFKIVMQKTSDFPNFPSIENKAKFEINANLLSLGLKKVATCIEEKNPRTEFTGALIDIKKENISLVGSDGKKLSVFNLNIQNEKEFKIILPKRAIIEVQKLFTNNIDIFYDDTMLIAKGENFLFYTKLINGRYADYEKVINIDFKNSVILNREKIIEGIRTVNIISENIKITLNKNSIDFEALSLVGDEAKTQIDVDLNIENSYELRLKYKNILDFLSTTNNENFELKYNEVAMPIMLLCDDLKTVITQINMVR